MSKETHHFIYLDFLRIFATFAVIVLHVAAQNWASTDIHSAAWHTFNFFDSLVRWAVPIFIMISGSIFLDNDRPLDTKKLYRKNILRLVIVYFVWAAVYAIDKWLAGAVTKDVILSLIGGHYHMWFLPMLIGLYIIVPLLRKITESEKATRYLLLVGMIFTFLIPQLLQFLSLLGIPHTADLLITTTTTYQFITFRFPGVYVMYFVLGYYLNKTELKKNIRKIIYLLGAMGAAATVILTIWTSYRSGSAMVTYYLDETVNVLLMSAGIFTFAKYNKRINAIKESRIPGIKKLSKYTLGVYLIHPLILSKLYIYFSIDTLSFQPILSVIGISLFTWIVSYFISIILNHIPIIKKYAL